jgi:ribosomal protein S18 acetylase RimI-like enzyme
MSVEIREATPADASEIAAVAEEAWHEVHAPIIGKQRTEAFLTRYYDTESLREVIDSDGWSTHVADAGDELAGFVSGGPDDERPDLFYLNRIYLRRAYWGNGIGSRLLGAFERDVATRGYGEMSLRVMVENDRAVQFYERNGFERHEKLYDEEVGTDSYVYVKELDGA